MLSVFRARRSRTEGKDLRIMTENFAEQRTALYILANKCVYLGPVCYYQPQ